MTWLEQILNQFLPEKAIPPMILLLCVGVGYVYIKYNIYILRFLSKIFNFLGLFFNHFFAIQTRKLEIKVLRTATLQKSSVFYNFYSKYDEMVTTLDLKKDGVEPMGLFLFLLTTSVFLTIFLTCFMHLNFILFIIAFFVSMFLETTLFRLLTLTRLERRERHIMDAVDCLCGNIHDGVKNAIRQCVKTDAIHPDIKPYFTKFCDNVELLGYSFADAMMELNSCLGPTFSDFCYKAILFESKHDEELAKTFSSVVIINQQKREVRQENARIFSSVIITFLICFVMIIGFTILCSFLEPNVVIFFTTNWFGKLLVLGDICLCAAVIYFITALKAKSI